MNRVSSETLIFSSSVSRNISSEGNSQGNESSITTSPTNTILPSPLDLFQCVAKDLSTSVQTSIPLATMNLYRQPVQPTLLPVCTSPFHPSKVNPRQHQRKTAGNRQTKPRSVLLYPNKRSARDIFAGFYFKSNLISYRGIYHLACD